MVQMFLTGHYSDRATTLRKNQTPKEDFVVVVVDFIKAKAFQ